MLFIERIVFTCIVIFLGFVKELTLKIDIKNTFLRAHENPNHFMAI